MKNNVQLLILGLSFIITAVKVKKGSCFDKHFQIIFSNLVQRGYLGVGILDLGGESVVTLYMCDITLVHIRDYQGVTNDG